MDHEERIKAKKEIIKTSQEEASSIPLLPYHHLEIVNFETYIDGTLIEALDYKTLVGGLTDELFFDCIESNPDYLAFEPFRKKIKKWQDIIYSETAPNPFPVYLAKLSVVTRS